MTINYTPAFDPATYLQRLQNLIKAVEGEEFSVYVDSTGNPTIGWGFALNSHGVAGGITDVIEKALGVNPNRNSGGLSPTAKVSEQAFEDSLKAILKQTWAADKTVHHTGQSTADLRTKLKAVLDNRAADIAAHRNGYTVADQIAIGTPATAFAYSTVDQISTTFGIIKTVMDRRLDTSLGTVVPNTNERIALFAMQYLGAMNDHMKGLLNTAFSQNAPSDARALAWYAIRYQNNAGWEQRSYVEAAMFGLYNDNNNVTVDDAKAVYRMFTMHRDEILAYDSAHSTALADANVAVKSATGGIVGALTTAQALALACGQIFTDIAQGTNPDIVAAYVKWTEAGNNITNFDPRNLYLDPGRENATQTISPNTYTANLNASGNTIPGSEILIGESTTGSFGDYLIAGAGNDLLIGGDGNDILVAGSGYDYMAGGAGNDTYYVNAGGHVTIEDKSGINTLIIEGRSIADFFSTDGGQNWACDDNNITAVMQNGDFIITDRNNSLTTEVTLNNDFQSGDFGIRLITKQTDTPPVVTPAPAADYTYTGDFAPQEFTDEIAYGTAIDPSWKWGYIVNIAIGKTENVLDGSGNVVGTKILTQIYTHYNLDEAGNNIQGQAEINRSDAILGTSGNDLLQAGGGNNTIIATQGGNDTLIGADGNNSFAAGDGNNTIQVGSGSNILRAGNGNNSITTLGNGNNTLTVGNGKNTLTTGGGNDQITAGNGDNLISGGGGQDVILAGNGNNQIYADTQIDLATALVQQKTALASGLKGSLIAVGDGNNTIIGGNGNDAIFTGTGNNTLVLGAGAVTVQGGVEVSQASPDWSVYTNAADPFSTNYSGISEESAPFNAPNPYHGNYSGTNSFVPVGTGNDTIYGGTGNSVYWLSNGDNWLDAGGGNDLIFAGVGNNTIFGGTGNDTIYGAGGNNYINLESGNDLVIAQGGNHTIIGGTGDDTIASGDAGMSTTSLASETSANNYIYGGSGNTLILGSGGNDTLISGSQSGTGKSTNIYGGDGNEYIVGGDGSDTIFGGTGKDTIYAGDGNTLIQLSSNANETSIVYGGTGSDTIRGGAGNDVIFAGDGGTISATTQVYAGSGTSTIYGGAGVNLLKGGSGSDTLIAGSGTSTLQGGTGTEVMYSADGNSTLIAGTGNDTLYGGSGTDVLKGSSGNTLFVAGSGNETISGGSGSNTYELDAGFGNIEIKATSGQNKLVFGSGISLTDLTFSVGFGSDGLPALVMTSGDGGVVTIDGGMSGCISSFSFSDSGQTFTSDQLFGQAKWDASSQPDISKLESQYLAQQQASTLSQMGSGYAQQADGSWYQAPQLIESGWYRDFYAGSTVTTFIYGTSTGQSNTVVINTPNWWATDDWGIHINDSTFVAQQLPAVTLTDQAVYSSSAGYSYSSSTSPNQVGLSVKWVSDPNGYSSSYANQWSVSGYMMPDGSFSFYNGAGAIPATGFEIQESTSSAYFPAPLNSTVLNSLTTPVANFSISSGHGALPQVLDLNYTHSQTTFTTQQIDIVSGDHTVYGGTVVNAGSGNNTIENAGLVYSGTGNNTIDNADVVYGGTGNDTVNRSNIIYAGSGNDVITDSYQVYAGSGHDTIVGSSTVFGGTGDNTIDQAGTVYQGSGNDTITNSWQVYAGSGNDLLIGDQNVVAGSGNDTILGSTDFNANAYWGTNTLIDPNTVGNVLVGGIADIGRDLLYAFYQSTGITDWENRYVNGGKYQVQQPWWMGPGAIFTETDAEAYAQNSWGVSFQQAKDYGWIGKIQLLPVLAVAPGSEFQPSAYYAAAGIPVTQTFVANDYISLLPYYAQMKSNGAYLLNTVTFASGILPTDLKFAWGQVTTSMSGLTSDPQLQYTTLDMTWGTSNQSVRVIIPHSDEPVGSGVSDFIFADGTQYSMADMLAIAPVAPWVYQYQSGMGSIVLNSASGYTDIQFGPGITSSMITLGLGSLMLRVGDSGDVIHIENFDPANALAAKVIRDFSFSDGTTLTYDQLLSRGFDIYGTTGNETLTGTNLDNRIYAGSGNDTLIGSGAHDTLYGGVGNDTLIAGSGSDMLVAGTGGGTMIGGTGKDTFVLNQGDGQQTIIDTLKSSGDTVQLGAGITAGDTRCELHGNDLLISYGTQGNSILLKNFLPTFTATGSSSIREFQYADGSHSYFWSYGTDYMVVENYNAAGNYLGYTSFSNDGAGNITLMSNNGESGYWNAAYGSTNSVSNPDGTTTYSHFGPDGSCTISNYDVSGHKTSDSWKKSDGSYGSDTFNADNSVGYGITHNPDGSFSTTTNDTHGNTSTINYDANGNKLSDIWTKYDGSSGSDTYNAAGTSSGTCRYWDGTYSNYTGDSNGVVTTTNYSFVGAELGHSTASTGSNGIVTTVNYDVSGTELGYSTKTTGRDGIVTTMTYDASGVGLGFSAMSTDSNGIVTTTNYDISGTQLGYSIISNDGQGNITLVNHDASGAELGRSTNPFNWNYKVVDNYDANGNLLSDILWQTSSGYYGTDTYSADGSGTYAWSQSDGAYGNGTWGADGSGSDDYHYADGSYGNDIWYADGSWIGGWHNADGSYATYTSSDNWSNYNELDYSANGNMTGDYWNKADGSRGQDTFNADGSSSGASYSADGSYSSYTNDGRGDVTTNYFDVSGNLLSYNMLVVDVLGNGTTINYDASGNVLGSNVSTNDGLGDTSTTNYDASGTKLSDNWSRADGSHGSDTFNADGTSSGISYSLDGSYSSYTNDGIGKVTTTNFDANSNELGYRIAINNGQGTVTTTQYDALGTVLGSSVLTNDGHGDVTTIDYDASGNKLSDNWTKADGTHGSDTFNADGSSSGTTYNADGSYGSYTNDGHGNLTTLYSDALNHLVGDQWTHADGSSGSDLIDAASGQVVSSIINAGISGNETLTGNAGQNTFVFSLGEGQDMIIDTANLQNSLAGKDTIIFGAGIASTNISFVQQGTGLMMSYSLTDSILIEGSSLGGQIPVSTFRFADGTAITYTFDGKGGYTFTNLDAQGNQISDQWTHADGSYGTDVIDPVTGMKVSGTVTNPVKGYIDTYTRTQLDNGNVETIVNYTYTDGSTYTTDTVKAIDGSYQQTWSKSLDGSSGTTNYTSLTGEKSGTINNPAKGFTEVFDNTVLANGSTEAVITYTYTGGSTFTTDTVKAADGSYQQSWSRSDSSSGTTNYIATTGEKSGTINNPAKGFTEVFDNTVLADGSTEAKLAYSYTDGSTYSTDTVKIAYGSYVQTWNRSDGSSGTTNYNAITLEKSGIINNPAKGYSEVFDDTVLAGGSTEAAVTYTYTDGSTYTTDTVKAIDGSYQQSWSRSDGSSGTTNYNAITLEKSGIINNPAKGYSEVFDNTVLAGGSTEAVVTYTYTDGSTYTTDTVKTIDGSYQQTWSKSLDGSSGTTNYAALTGEKTGIANYPAKGYNETFDDTVLSNGSTEAVINYTYTNGSTYTTDTVKAIDGSYTQVWSKSNGTSGTKVVDNTGVVVADSWVHADGSQGVDAGGNHLVLGTSAANTIKALSTGNEIMIGGTGNDTLTTGSNTNLIAFDKGDGKDKVYASAGVNNILSLGGNFAYNDLTLQKSSTDLILNVSATDSITFKGWYAGNHNIVDLQVIAAAMSDFNPGSSDVLRNSNVEEFDFQKLVASFDSALVATPGLTTWGVTNALLDAHLSSSDTAALGGDLAYTYGTNGNLTGMGVAAAESTLSSSQFATAPQTLNPWPSLNTGTVQIK